MDHDDSHNAGVDGAVFRRIVQHSLEEVLLHGKVGENGRENDENAVEESLPESPHDSLAIPLRLHN